MLQLVAQGGNWGGKAKNLRTTLNDMASPESLFIVVTEVSVVG